MVTHPEFEQLATSYLSVHPDIAHEWHRIEDRWSGDRTDLVCAPGTDNEVYATLREGAIAVGSNEIHTDFENFGRGITQTEIAEAALQHLIGLLAKHGLIEANET